MGRKLKITGGIIVGLLAASWVDTSIRESRVLREAARVAALTPEERAAEDSARAVRDSVTRRERALDPDYQIALAHLGLKQRARDPESVRFRNEVVFTRGDTLVVCGEVNAANGLGGLTGYRPYVSLGGGAVVLDRLASPEDQRIFAVFSALCANRP